MYTIRIRKHRKQQEQLLYSSANTENYPVISATLETALSSAGSLVFAINEDNPFYGNIEPRVDEICVYDTETEAGKASEDCIFVGYVVSIDKDFNNTETYTCDGALAYLNDTVQSPYDYSLVDQLSIGYTIESLLHEVVNGTHSNQIDLARFEDDELYVADGSFNILTNLGVDLTKRSNRSWDSYITTFDCLEQHFLQSSIGGWLNVERGNLYNYLVQGVPQYYRVNTLRYFDKSYVTQTGQSVEFKVNLLDFARHITCAELATAVLPIGRWDITARKGENLYLNESTGGEYFGILDRACVYVDREKAKEIGYHMVIVDFEDITTREGLLAKAQEYVAEHDGGIESFDVAAVDLTLAGESVDKLKLGKSTHIISNKHGFDQWLIITAINYDLCDPTNNEYTFGDTDYASASSSGSMVEASGSIDNIYERVKRLEDHAGQWKYLFGRSSASAGWTNRTLSEGSFDDYSEILITIAPYNADSSETVIYRAMASTVIPIYALKKNTTRGTYAANLVISDSAISSGTRRMGGVTYIDNTTLECYNYDNSSVRVYAR